MLRRALHNDEPLQWSDPISQLSKLERNSGAANESTQRALRILLVGTADRGGGAESSAWNLLEAYTARGHKSWMAVGTKRTDDARVALLPNQSRRSRWAKIWQKQGARLNTVESRIRGVSRLQSLLRFIGEPRRWLDVERGYEDFHYPGTWQLFELFGVPDIVHCFNLHGSYFDLRALTWLSRRLPVIVDLRDAWLLSGHCAHSFDCERWKTGCGSCPDLTIYPAIQRDGTAQNWRRKEKIYRRSRLHVVTPSKWLMGKITESMLAPALVTSHVIPTGVDLSVFRPVEKSWAKAVLGLPADATMLLFVGNKVRRNIWKDHATMRAAILVAAQQSRKKNIVFVGLGEESATERVGNVEFRSLPYQGDVKNVARYYQAADIYLHAARVDTFPRAVIEALACGTPVIGTAVGGIPEQIKGLKCSDSGTGQLEEYSPDDATGALVTAGDVASMAAAVERLIDNDALRLRLGNNAYKDACRRFSLQRQVESYLTLYERLISAQRRQIDGSSTGTVAN
jgi:glycosyltransferase involved in cell wall biosynthesis